MYVMGFVSVTPVSGRRDRLGNELCSRWTGFTGQKLNRSVVSAPRARGSRRTQISMEADYYGILGVSRDCNEKDLKTAYRKLARKYHPDVNPSDDAKEKFQECTTAYEVLTDPQKRRMYDQFGEAGVSGAAGAGPGFSDFGDFGGIGDIFETFFGGGQGGGSRRRSNGPIPGEDLRVNLDIDFNKAAFGGDHKIRLSHLENCNTCSGSGVKPGTQPRTCGTCNGSGTVVTVARTPLGAFQQQSTCADCRGTGQIVDEYCGTCGGRGRIQKSKQLSVTIPAGVDTGSRLRVRGEGDAGLRGGPAGDLYVVLRVKSDPRFQREGQTIYSTVQVSYVDAILGKKIPVDVIDGQVELKVPAGTQPLDKLKISSKGIPKIGVPTSRGDHIVTVKVSLPKKLSNEEKELIRKLGELEGAEVKG